MGIEREREKGQKYFRDAPLSRRLFRGLRRGKPFHLFSHFTCNNSRRKEKERKKKKRRKKNLSFKIFPQLAYKGGKRTFERWLNDRVWLLSSNYASASMCKKKKKKKRERKSVSSLSPSALSLLFNYCHLVLFAVEQHR